MSGIREHNFQPSFPKIFSSFAQRTKENLSGIPFVFFDKKQNGMPAFAGMTKVIGRE